MTKPTRLATQRFRSLVATFLHLPADSGDVTVRTALRRKGPDFVEWYDTRIRAIAEAQPESHTPRQFPGHIEDSRHR